MWDKQGVLRGECTCGDCVEFMTGCDVRCEYCDCVPTNHKKIEGHIDSGKDYSVETYNTFPVPPVTIQGNSLIYNDTLATFDSNTSGLPQCRSFVDTKPDLPCYDGMEKSTSDSSDVSEACFVSLRHIKPLNEVSFAAEDLTKPVAETRLTEIQSFTSPLSSMDHSIKTEADSDTSCYSMSEVGVTETSVPVVKTDLTKSVPCCFCTKLFTYTKSRNRHMRKVHPDSVHICQICKKLFILETELAEHFHSKHEEDNRHIALGEPRSLPGDKSKFFESADLTIKEESMESDDFDLEFTGHLLKNETKDLGKLSEGQGLGVQRMRAHQMCIKLKDSTIRTKLAIENDIESTGNFLELEHREHKKSGELSENQDTVDRQQVKSHQIRIKLKDGTVRKTKKSRSKRPVRIKPPVAITDVLEPSSEPKTENNENSVSLSCVTTASQNKSVDDIKPKKKINVKKPKLISTSEADTAEPFPCDCCGKLFQTEQQKKKHERSAHAPAEYHCQYCGKVYKRMYDLEDHERSHTGQRPFQCEVCDKAFFSKHNLRTHEHLHKTRGAYICMYCGKDFDSKSGMEYHELKHTGLRPHECTVCKKTFKHPSALATHQRIHTGEKPYPCQYCTKSFRDHSTLRKHVRIHTLEKPYKCAECDKAYNQRWCLKTHYIKSHAGVPIPVYNTKYPMI